jgi:hypothetical protein
MKPKAPRLNIQCRTLWATVGAAARMSKRLSILWETGAYSRTPFMRISKLFFPRKSESATADGHKKITTT